MDEREIIFNRLRPLLSRYSPPLTARTDEDGSYELWSEKDVLIEGQKRKEVFFASLNIRSTYVGFDFMPAIAEGELARVFSPRLRSLLKDKSCFHIKTVDGELTVDIGAALEVGWEMYRARAWV